MITRLTAKTFNEICLLLAAFWTREGRAFDTTLPNLNQEREGTAKRAGIQAFCALMGDAV